MEVHTSHHHGHRLSTDTAYCKNGGRNDDINLDVYPNPSRDMFNDVYVRGCTNLEVRVMNVVGEVAYTENLEEFVGEYTKKIDLATYTKGVYFRDHAIMEVNKKLIII